MKILFLHVYNEKNTGDCAIISVMLERYRKQYPAAEIVLSSITRQKKSTFADAPYISSFFQEAIYTSSSSWQRMITTFGVVFGALTGVFPSRSLKNFVQEIKSADLVVGVGGGYIIARNNLHDTISLVLTLLEFWFCKRNGKQVVLEAMSIGPLETSFQRKLTAHVLNMVDTIQVRENISYRLLKEIGVTKPVIKKSMDLAFYFTPKTKTKMRNYLMKRGVFFTKSVLGITVKQCFPAGDVRQTAYEEALAGFVNAILEEKDIKVIFIPHVTAKLQNDDDRDVIKRIKPLITRRQDVLFLMDEFDYRDIKGIYENLSYLVGTRMHSVIFALTAKIPVVAIAYEPKTNGIMATLGLQKNVLNADKVTIKTLISAFSGL